MRVCALASHTLAECLYQTRFTDAGLAAQQHHLAPTFLALPPALEQQRHFRLTAHQGREAAGLRHLQATLRRTFPQDTIHLERRSQALERVCPQVLTRKVSLD